jgi:hypothetical protein
VLAVRQTALRAAGCLRDDTGLATYLSQVAWTFLITAKGGSQKPGDAAKLDAAAQAVTEWLSTLHPSAGGVKGEEKPAPVPSLAEVKGEEKPAPGPSLAG